MITKLEAAMVLEPENSVDWQKKGLIGMDLQVDKDTKDREKEDEETPEELGED